MLAQLARDTQHPTHQNAFDTEAANDPRAADPRDEAPQEGSDVLMLSLTQEEKRRLHAALAPIRYCDAGSARYIRAVRRAASEALPERFISALAEQKASLAPRPCLVFDNLPTDDLVFGSPRSDESGLEHKSGSISENLAIAFSVLIGEPYSISFEGRELVNNLVPERGKERDFTGLGSDVELDFHIENAALKFIEDLDLTPCGLVLTGVRQDPSLPKTRVADVRAALQRLDAQDLRVLRGRNFLLRVPYRWRAALGSSALAQTPPSPLVSGCALQPQAHVAFYPDMVVPLNEAAAAAFHRFHQAVREVSFGIDVMPGRLVYVDNRIALHSRDRFQASYDERGRALRWLQRVFIAPTLWNHRNLTRLKDRVFEPAAQAA